MRALNIAYDDTRLATLLVDAHVHIHECFPCERFLDAAAANFSKAKDDLHADGDVFGTLMLTESAGMDCFAALADGKLSTGAWQIRPTEESVSLLATRSGALPVLVIAGRQILSAERIEVLALGTRAQIPDGQPLASTIDAVWADGALAVLPWGFGKWWGKRGRVVDAYLAKVPPSKILLGDNGGRPTGLPAPRQFVRASLRGVRILPGSDPLPRAGELDRVGRYGFALRLKFNLIRPALALKAHVDELERQPPTFGRLQSPARFVINQLSLRLRKWRSGHACLQHNTTTPDVETASDDYARRFSGAIGGYLLAEQERIISDLLGSSGPRRILEVGGGHAQVAPALLDAGHEVWVQGSTQDCVRRLAPLFARYPGRLHFVVSSLWALPFPDRAFDLVVAIRLLAHVEQFDPLLREMARVSDGCLIVDFPPVLSANLWQPLLFGVKRRVEGNTRPFFCYNAGQLYRPLRAAGFEKFRITKQFTLPMVVHRKIASPGFSQAIETGCRRAGLTRLFGSPSVLLAQRLPGAGSARADGMPASKPATASDSACRQTLMVAPQPFFRVTGTPINVLTMCRALTDSGIAVHLLTLPYGDDVAFPGLTLHRVGRLPWVRRLPVGFSIGKLAYHALLVLAFLRLFRCQRFAAVHAIEEAAFWAVPLARLGGVPAIIDLDSDLRRQLRDHGSLLARMLAAPAGWLRGIALRRAAGALTVSQQLSKIARAANPGIPVFEINDIPIEGAYRQPDGEAMLALRAQFGLVGRRLVVYTGNYDRRQGLLELIQAMAVVCARHPSVLLLLVGGEPDQVRALQARIEGEKLADAVRLIGAQPPNTMPEYMGLAEVLVSPRLEPHSTPLKVFSYMASGRPIVATDLPTHTEVLDAKTAILVPPTPAGLAQGICRALEDPAGATALGRRAQLLVEQRYTYAGFKRHVAEFYAAVLGPATTRALAADQAERSEHG